MTSPKRPPNPSLNAPQSETLTQHAWPQTEMPGWVTSTNFQPASSFCRPTTRVSLVWSMCWGLCLHDVGMYGQMVEGFAVAEVGV